MTIDLTRDVLPISKAAGALASLIAQTQKTQRPIIITLKGYPAAVLLDAVRFQQLSTAPIDLLQGVLPISKAASSLAKRISQAQQTKQPIVITQKGRPAAVLLDLSVYVALEA